MSVNGIDGASSRLRGELTGWAEEWPVRFALVAK